MARRRRAALAHALVLLGAFIIYQCYRLTYGLTVGMTLLTIFDAFVIWLTWREWHNASPSRPGDDDALAGLQAR